MKKLLIVDDSMISRNSIEKHLQDFDLEVVGIAKNGETAINIFQRNLPDIVTLDITMPKLDGIACLEEMLKIKPDCKILMITALKDKGTVLQALKKGAKGYIAKPFKAEKLQAEFQKMLDES